MPEVSIFPAYGAGVMIATRVVVDEATTANKLKAYVGHDKTAYLFARLPRHEYLKECLCFSCHMATPTKTRPVNWYWTRAGWMRDDPGSSYWRWVRFDMGARNVRLAIQGGEHFVVVAACDVDTWLAELASSGRLGMMLALGLTIERKSKREAA